MHFRAFLVISLMFTCTQANAGKISGKVTFEGEAPVMRVIEMDVDPICASKHESPIFSEVLVMGDGQTMANILVQITKGIPDIPFEIPTNPVRLTQEGCQYSPHVLAVRAGQPLEVLNPDGTLHNVHGLAKTNPEFNKSMTPTVNVSTFVFAKPEDPFPLKCQVHPWMTAYLAVLDHPYFDVTETDGKYEIPELPDGEYTVQAWHERLGVQTAQVTVTFGDAVVADFTFSR